MEKLTGKFVEFDSAARRGVIEGADGKRRVVRPYSFRKTTNLQLGDSVSFTSWNFLEGVNCVGHRTCRNPTVKI
jgi:hypothetical protein